MSLLPGKFYYDNFLDDFIRSEKEILMSCDIYEENNNYNLIIDVPGFNKENITINYFDNYLTIEAIKEDSINESDKHYIRKERRFGSFKRQFYVGNVDEDKIEAEFKDGVLKVIVPKNDKNTNSKKIIDIK